jgi:hypothetical protein
MIFYTIFLFLDRFRQHLVSSSVRLDKIKIAILPFLYYDSLSFIPVWGFAVLHGVL